MYEASSLVTRLCVWCNRCRFYISSAFLFLTLSLISSSVIPFWNITIISEICEIRCKQWKMANSVRVCFSDRSQWKCWCCDIHALLTSRLCFAWKHSVGVEPRCYRADWSYSQLRPQSPGKQWLISAAVIVSVGFTTKCRSKIRNCRRLQKLLTSSWFSLVVCKASWCSTQVWVSYAVWVLVRQ